jgi:hypothetical protein
MDFQRNVIKRSGLSLAQNMIKLGDIVAMVMILRQRLTVFDDEVMQRIG